MNTIDKINILRYLLHFRGTLKDIAYESLNYDEIKEN